MLAFLAALLFGFSPVAAEPTSNIVYCYNEVADESLDQSCNPIGGSPTVTRVNGPTRSVPPSQFP